MVRYVFVLEDGALWLLVHRRSDRVVHSRCLCTPGSHLGIWHPSGACGTVDFETEARKQALRELGEESGLLLPQTAEITLVPKCDERAKQNHANFAVLLPGSPDVPGPLEKFKFEVRQGGMNGIGKPAGEGFHA